jgi:hypothetical protein
MLIWCSRLIKPSRTPVLSSKKMADLRAVLKRIRMAKHLDEPKNGSKEPKANDGHDFEGLDNELDDECGLSYKDERCISNWRRNLITR